MLRKLTSLILCFSLFLTHAGLAEVGQTLNLANYITQGPQTLSPLGFQPPVLRYFSYDAREDNFQFLLDPQDLKDKLSEDQTKSLAHEQLNYFLVGLSLPNSQFWVNLRPDAPDNIIEPELEQTEVGRIMLESDLQLKKDTANLTSPQTKEGRLYWDKLYEKAKELFGREPANIPTITRPWIVPGEILIREDEGAAYVYKATLKVMLEEDYLTSPQSTVHSPQNYSFNDPRMKELNVYSSQLIRELILPKLTQEVNSGKNYASLRQVYYSLVLSRWFKQRFSQVTSDQRTVTSEGLVKLIDSGNLTNLTSKTPWSKSYYFNEYKKSFAQGEYNLKEQVTTPTGQVIRSYVSGGLDATGRSGTFSIDSKFPGKGNGHPNYTTGLPFVGSSGVISASPLSVEDVRKRIEEIRDEIRGAINEVVKVGYGRVWEKLSDEEREEIKKSYVSEKLDFSLEDLFSEIDRIGRGEDKLESWKKFLVAAERGGFSQTFYFLEKLMKDRIEKDVMKQKGWFERWWKKEDTVSEIEEEQLEVDNLPHRFIELFERRYSQIDRLSKSEFAELEKRTKELRNLLSRYASATGEGVSVPLQSLIEKFPKELETRTGRFWYSTSATIGRMIKEIIEILQKASLYSALKYEAESEQFVSLEELSSFTNEIISSLNTRLNDTVNKSILSDMVFDNLSEEQKTILDNLRQTIASLSKDFRELKEKIDSSPFLSQAKPSSNSSPLMLEQAKEKLRNLIREYFQTPGKLLTWIPNSEFLVKKDGVYGDWWFNTSTIRDNFDKIFAVLTTASQKLTLEVEGELESFTFKGLASFINQIISDIREPMVEINQDYSLDRVDELKISNPENENKLEAVKEFLRALAFFQEELTRFGKNVDTSSQRESEKVGSDNNVVSSSLEKEVGGIDLTKMLLQCEGGFKGIDLSLPLLSKKELESIDLEKEEEMVRNYLATGYNPHGDRLKRLLAGLFQKDQFSSRQLDLLQLSQKLCNFLSARGLDTTPDQRAFILITNTGLFLKQGQGKATIKPSLN